MKRGILSDLSPFLQLLLIFILVLISFMVVSAIGLALAIPFAGWEEVNAIAAGQSSIKWLRYLQMVNTVSVFIVPSLLAAWLFSTRPLHWLWFGRMEGVLIFLSFALIIVAQPLTVWLAELNHQFFLPDTLEQVESWMKTSEERANQIIFNFLNTSSRSIILYNVLLVVLLPAFGEEMLFRGAIQPTFQRLFKNSHAAVWITAILFSAMHMQFLTFLPRLILGALLGYMLVYGKSIWYPILGHLFHNLMSLVVFYYFRATRPEINPLEHEMNALPVWLIAVSCLMTFGLLLIFRRYYTYSDLENSFSDGRKT